MDEFVRSLHEEARDDCRESLPQKSCVSPVFRQIDLLTRIVRELPVEHAYGLCLVNVHLYDVAHARLLSDVCLDSSRTVEAFTRELSRIRNKVTGFTLTR